MDEMLDEIERYVRYCVDNHAGMPAMEIIGSKWLIRILFHLCRRSPLRFGQIKRIIPEISNAALATGLRELQEKGLVSRKQYNELPLRVEYSVTEAGLELMKLNYRIIAWEQQYCSPEK